MIKPKRRIFISSLVTFAAVGAFSVNMAQASYLGVNKNSKRHESGCTSTMLSCANNVLHDTIRTSDEQQSDVLEPMSKRERRARLRCAMEQGDWESFRESCGRSVIDTNAKFHTMREARALFAQGRSDEGWEIARSIGILDDRMWRKVIG